MKDYAMHIVNSRPSLCSIWHIFYFLIQSNRTCAAVFFTMNYFLMWIFQFLIATKDSQLFFPLLVWMNAVEWMTIISLLQ